jgi:hemoglobin-like flavoprotein
MTAREIELLEHTLAELRRRSMFASQLFYCRLFARRPALRRLFGGTPDFHGTRLLAVMASAVAGLSDQQLFCTLVRMVGRPPVRETLTQGNCVQEIGDALQWMLERHFHGQLSAEVRDAWRSAYRGLAQAVEHELNASA